MGALYVALLHGQVIDKTGKEISSALTHFDVHDIARTCRCYGVERYFIVTPLETMRHLAQRMISYWNSGLGNHAIPNRGDAMEIVEVETTLDRVVEWISEKDGESPRTVATSASTRDGLMEYESVRSWIWEEEFPVLVLFGTAYGMSESVLSGCDGILEPIRGRHWNHLSVRSAVAITLERLVSEKDNKAKIEKSVMS